MIILGAPTDLQGCLLWLDASDSASVIRDGSNVVSQWSDKSGNANHATEANPTNRPTYSATAFGGLPGLDWGNGSVVARALTTPSISYGVFTIFIVVRGDPSSNYVYVHDSDNGSNREYIHGDPNPNINIRRGGVQSMRAVVLPYQSATGVLNRDGVRRIITRRYGGTHATNTVRVDLATPQTNVISGQFFDPGTGASNAPIYLGNRQAYDNPLRGVLAEFIVFNRVLSDGEVALVEQYLSRKWRIAVESTRLIASPLEILNCSMWFDASQGITQSGGLVSQWDDSSGNGRHITQASDPLKPTYNAANAAFGGKPTVDWLNAGAGTRLDAAAVTLTQPNTVLACCSLTPGTSNIALFDNQSGTEWGFGRVNATATLYVFSPSVQFPTPAEVVAGRPFTLAMQHQANQRTLVKLNGATAAGGASTGTAISVASFRLGTFINGFTSGNWLGSIAEFILYNRRLNEAEIAMGEAYLRRKYAL